MSQPLDGQRITEDESDLGSADLDARIDDSYRRSILISGAGPVGMVLALELSLHGVPSTLIEQAPQTTRFPKMDLTNSRSMELLDRLGLVDEIRAAGVEPHH